MITKAKAATGIVTFLMAGSLAACGSGGSSSDAGPRVGTFPLDLLGVAEKQGAFAEKPQIQFVDSGPAALPLVSSGALDGLMGIASLPVVSAESKGIKMKVVWIDGQAAPARLVAQPSITNAEGLRGKKVAVPVGSIAHLMLGQYLTENDMSLRDVEVVDIPPPQMPAAFTRKSVDAIFVWDPPGLAAQNSGGKVLDERGMVLYTSFSNDYIEKNPAKVQSFVCGLAKTYKLFADDPDEVYPVLAKVAQVDDTKIKSIFTSKNAAPADQTAGGFFGSEEVVKPLEDAVPFLKAQGAIKNEPSNQALKGLFDDTFVKGVSEGKCG